MRCLDNGLPECLLHPSSEHENTLEHQIPISLYIIHIFIYTHFFYKKYSNMGFLVFHVFQVLKIRRFLEQMKETDIVKAIMKYLRTVPGCFCWKEHGGMYGTAGIPDIVA